MKCCLSNFEIIINLFLLPNKEHFKVLQKLFYTLSNYQKIQVLHKLFSLQPISHFRKICGSVKVKNFKFTLRLIETFSNLEIGDGIS